MSDFVTFNQWVKDYGIVEAILRLDFKQKYIVTVDGLPRKVRVFEKDSIYRKTFTAFEEDFQKFIAAENKGREPAWKGQVQGQRKGFRILRR